MGSFSVTQIQVQSNPAVGLFIAGILHRILERAVISSIELMHRISSVNTGLCTFYFIDKIVSVLYIVNFYAEQHTGAWCESLNERRSRRIGLIA